MNGNSNGFVHWSPVHISGIHLSPLMIAPYMLGSMYPMPGLAPSSGASMAGMDHSTSSLSAPVSEISNSHQTHGLENTVASHNTFTATNSDYGQSASSNYIPQDTATGYLPANVQGTASSHIHSQIVSDSSSVAAYANSNEIGGVAQDSSAASLHSHGNGLENIVIDSSNAYIAPVDTSPLYQGLEHTASAAADPSYAINAASSSSGFSFLDGGMLFGMMKIISIGLLVYGIYRLMSNYSSKEQK